MNLILLLILGALWGSSYLFIRVTVAEIPALTLVAGRLLLGAAILWILLGLSGRTMPRSRRLWGSYAVMGILSGAVPWTLISWGEQYISSGLASLLQATMPLFTVILAHLLAADEPITWRKLSGVVVGFLGVAVLMIPDLREGLHTHVLGQLAIVASSISYGAAALFARQRLRGQHALLSTTGQLTMGAVFMVPISLVVNWPLHLVPSLAATVSWLALTCLGTVIAYMIYYPLIERTSATFVSTVTYIIPLYGLALGSLVLGEPIDAFVLISLALIFGGVMLVRS
jgi:drug/metabolite transporter (DMT)-like permease